MKQTTQHLSAKVWFTLKINIVLKEKNFNIFKVVVSVITNRKDDTMFSFFEDAIHLLKDLSGKYPIIDVIWTTLYQNHLKITFKTITSIIWSTFLTIFSSCSFTHMIWTNNNTIKHRNKLHTISSWLEAPIPSDVKHQHFFSTQQSTET